MSDSKHQIAKDFIARSFREAYKPNWPKELKLFYQLLKQYPDLSFWQNFEMPFKLRSLAFLKSERGRELLDANYNGFVYKSKEPKKIKTKEPKKFSDVLISEDKDVKVKQTIKQFLKDYGKS